MALKSSARPPEDRPRNSAQSFPRGLINMSGGESNLSAPAGLMRLLKQAMNRSHFSAAPSEGLSILRQAISAQVKQLYSQAYDPETEITITAGASQAIYTAISTFVSEEDEVILFEPAYETYAPAIRSCHGHPVFIRYKPPDFRIDWDEVLKGITNRTRLIIINSPHNPTGSILTAFDMEKIQKITNGTRILVLSDEVFEHIIFEGVEHQSVARYPQLVERSLLISSFGKTFNLPGLKLGYCLAPENLMQAFRKAHLFQTGSVHVPFQHALAEYLADPELFLGYHATIEKKRNIFLKNLQGTPWKFRPSLGSYFQVLDSSKLTEKPDTAYALWLAEHHGLLASPMSQYYHDHGSSQYLRFCLAFEDEVLIRAGQILLSVAEK